MNIQEKRKAIEKLLAGAPELMSPLQVSKWTPYGRNTIYAMLIVKHALIAAEKMKIEGDSISGLTNGESSSSYVRWDNDDNT